MGDAVNFMTLAVSVVLLSSADATWNAKGPGPFFRVGADRNVPVNSRLLVFFSPVARNGSISRPSATVCGYAELCSPQLLRENIPASNDSLLRRY